MKKFYSTICFLSLVILSFSQEKFFERVAYRGAFAPGVPMWTDNWTNWDPQNTTYPATSKTVNADITANTTWSTGDVIFLQNKVYVSSGVTLTIQPGVIIRGDKATEATLIISRGAKINAQGTATNPIVFTSNFAAGSRGLGDWGGVVLLGAATINAPGGTAVIEGGLDAVKANYGGTNDLDNTGTFSYVRIEFAGFPFQPDKEINGLTFGGVGSGTTIDHIQCSFTNDDSFEWFGGTVHCKYLVAYRGLDDDFDTDFGFRGLLQFLIAIRDPQIADQSASSTSEGFESDNDAAGSDLTPYTMPIFSNVTLIGPYRGSTSNTIDTKFKRGARVRRNSYLSCYNSIIMDWPTAYHIDGASSEGNATTDSLRFKNNIMAGMNTGKALQMNGGTPFNIYTWFAGKLNDTIALTTGILVSPYNYNTPDYRPSTSSPAATGASFTDSYLAPLTGFGINKTTENFIANVYPNPNNGSFNIEFNQKYATPVTITVIDLAGKSVYSTESEAKSGVNNMTINTPAITNGFYFLQIETNEGKSVTKILVN